MKLLIPFAKWVITQTYAENANTYYAEAGRKGHGAWDIVAIGSDKNIYAACDGYVFSTMNKDNPDLMRYRGVFVLVEDQGLFYELVYGHCDKIFVTPGTYVRKGDILATEGNTGDVASGGKKVTAQEKKNGSRKGAHLHFQLRSVKPVEKTVKGGRYLNDEKSYLKKDGMYFEIQNYNNGYVGCIDIGQFIKEESAKPAIFVDRIIETVSPYKSRAITSVLKYGSKGEQVKIWQSILGIKEDGVFGVQTVAATKTFQTEHGLTTDGIVGPLTLAAVYN